MCDATPRELTVCGKPYRIARLLGHGKGGYSYLAEDAGAPVVVKQIHHEPCDYYAFGNKLEAERNDYKRLLAAGIRIPKLLAIDAEEERIVKQYIDGHTVASLLERGESAQAYLPQVREMAAQAKASGLNIDYYPTNFVVQGGLLWYVDYECNAYMDEWSFETWGEQYWSRQEKTMQEILKLSTRPALFEQAAAWFSSKWGVPKQAYLDSMAESLTAQNGVPEWYVILNGEAIIAGIGVIANDFHKRKDLTPNLCAVYVEKAYRGQGIARRLMDRACEELHRHGVGTAYLITGHTEFYERCGWTFYGMIEEDDGERIRMYTRPTGEAGTAPAHGEEIP